MAIASANAIFIGDTPPFSSTLAPPSGSVDTVFGRSGNVLAQTGDYGANLITYSNTLGYFTASNVQDAIDEIGSERGYLVIDESGAFPGWYLRDDDRTHKGAIGPYAIDLSVAPLGGTGGGTLGATGDNSICWGSESRAAGQGATAGGITCFADGNGALAMGILNIAEAQGSVALGIVNVIGPSANGSVALGAENIVNGSHSGVIGFDNRVPGATSFAVGAFHNIDSDDSFCSGRSNTITGLGANTATGQGHTITSSDFVFAGGRDNVVTGSGISFAFGLSNTLNSTPQSFMMGYGNSTNGGSDVTFFGSNNHMTSAHTHVFVAGTDNIVNSDYSTAFGQGIRINGGDHRLSFGKFNIDSSANIVEVGWGTNDGNRVNNFEIRTNGVVTAPKMDVSEIVAEGNQCLTTKLYTDSYVSGVQINNTPSDGQVLQYNATGGYAEWVTLP